MIPPMNGIAAYIMKDMIKRFLQGEETVMRRAQSLIMRSGDRQGQFLIEAPPYFLAKMGGQGGARTEGKPILPPGVTSMETAWKEGFRSGGAPVIILARDYPGLSMKQASELFAVQARDLYRTETRGTNIGPDLSALPPPSPQTVSNMEAQNNYDDRLLERLRLMRIAYANTVLPSIEMVVPKTKCVQFTESRGRHPELGMKLEIGPINITTGLCLEKLPGNSKEDLIALMVKPDGPMSTQRFVEGCLDLSKFLTNSQLATMVCMKGHGALVYIAGGQFGSTTRNDIYDLLAVKGKQTGSPAPNSKVAYKDIRFLKYGVTVSRDSFVKRDNEVTMLPLSLDIRPAKPRESTTTAFQNSNNFDNDSGMVILPVIDAEDYDKGYDDHPSVVQYRMGYYVPAVIEFLRNAMVAHQIVTPKISLVERGDEWKEMRQSNSKVKEGDENDLLAATDVFAIPYGHEVVIVYDGNDVSMGFDSSGLHYTGTPQTNDLEIWSKGLNLKPYKAKGILTPTDESSYHLIDKVLKTSEEIDEAEQISRFLPLQLQVYGFEGSIGPFRSLAMPHARVCRNQSESFADVSERQGDLTFSEMVQEELDSGMTARLLMRFENAPERNLYPLQTIDAAIIGYDIAGKNPQNGIVGNVVVALSSMEKIKIHKGNRLSNTNSELYNPVGVVGAFANFTLEEKKRLFNILLDSSTHPGYKDGYMMVNPEELNMVLRISHKGVEKYSDQPVFRLVTEMKPFSGQTISFASSIYDEPAPAISDLVSDEEAKKIRKEQAQDKGKPGTSTFDRAQFGSRPEAIATTSMLFEVGKRKLPIIRSPNVQGFAIKVESFESQFVGDEKVGLQERFSKQNERLTMKVPLGQLPIRNPAPKFFGGGEDDDIESTWETNDDGGGTATYTVGPNVTREEAFEMVYSDRSAEWREEIQDIATENGVVYHLQGKQVDDSTFQLIVSERKRADADLLDIIRPAIARFGTLTGEDTLSEGATIKYYDDDGFVEINQDSWRKGLETNPKTYNIEHFPKGETSPRLKVFERKHRFVAVDEETDEMTGLLAVDADSSNLYITYFEVLAGFQQQGIGAQLLQSLIERFPQDEIILHRHPHKIPDKKLKGLLERFGFVDIALGKSGLMEMRRRPENASS
jgi:ribosomal protein S18 acetylase RimI-like enzyme